MAKRGGKREGAGRPKGSIMAINRDLLKVISDKDMKELIKKSYIEAYNGNERLAQYFMDQFLGKAQAQQLSEQQEINIWNVIKEKT